ncbi:MAG: hypothetical protein H0T58_01050 [Gemmatimonadales bacterium]|nr:hypothetical protein [Gemmatimonadales bacterium]
MGAALAEEMVGLLPATLAAPEIAQPDQGDRYHPGLDSLDVPPERFNFPFRLSPLAAQGEQ